MADKFDTFHPFPRLPAEIQREIWTLAVRPEGDGFHTLGFYHLVRPTVMTTWTTPQLIDFAAGPVAPDGETLITTNWFTPGTRELYRLTVPKDQGSTCLIDGGLWGACKDSRAVVKHAFKDRSDFARGYFDNGGKTNHYVRVDLEKDLFIWWPDNNVHLVAFPFGSLDFTLRLSCDWWGDIQTEGGAGINIGLNFDTTVFHGDTSHPYWKARRDELWGESPVTVGKHINMVWFIDTTIKRKHDSKSEALAPGRRTYTGSDRRYVEVLPDDAAWWDLPPGCFTEMTDSLWVVDRLNWMTGPWYGLTDKDHTDRFGVLALEF